MTWTGLADAAKAVAAALAAFGLVGYITGYLVLRARAHALGIAPPFDLVDEVYVFAGFRFLISLLILSVVAVPVAAAVSFGVVWIAARLPEGVATALAWVGLAVLAMVAVVFLSQVLATRDLLFVVHDLGSDVMAAPRGFLDPTVPGFALHAIVLETITLTLTALTGFWTVRIASARQWIVAGVALVLSLHLVLLPILHGTLRADRIVPTLTAVPDMVGGLRGPALIVDRNGSVATLFGFDEMGRAAVVTIAADKLHGLRQGKPVSLLEPWSGTRSEPGPATATELTAMHAELEQEPDRRTVRTVLVDAASAADEEGFLEAVVTQLGRLLENLGALSNNSGVSGRIIAVRLSADGTVDEAVAIGPDDGAFSWPVAGPGDDLYAVRDGALVRVEPQAARVLDAGLRWRKLLGVTPSGEVLGLVDGSDGPSGAIYMQGGLVRTVPVSRDAGAPLLAETHAQASGDVLEVNRSARGGRGLDVYLVRGGRRINLSGCGDELCVQPSLAPAADRVFYVRSKTD